MNEKYHVTLVIVNNERDDTETYAKLFDKIRELEVQLTLGDIDVWEYQEILKRKRQGNRSIYYVLLKKVK